MVSLWHQNTARAIRKHRHHLLSYGSRGTLMSYTDHSMQRRLKSHAPMTTYYVTSRPSIGQHVFNDFYFVANNVGDVK